MTRSDQQQNPIVIFVTGEKTLLKLSKVNQELANTLEEFRNEGARIYFVTDGTDKSAEWAEKDIQKAGFPQLIEKSITSSMMRGMHSLQPDYYLHLTTSVNVKPQDTIYIDHTPEALDFAKAEGAHVVSSDPQDQLVKSLKATYNKMKPT